MTADVGGLVSAWFARRTHQWFDWTIPELLEAKARGDHRISLVIPARNEEATIGAIVARVRAELSVAEPLVDEIVVIDSDSTDQTAARAAEAGARVHRSADIRPDLGSRPGKGEAMWKSQFVTSGDLLAFLDADLVEWGTQFVSGILAPLLTAPEVLLVKAFYDRPLRAAGAQPDSAELLGGRVTELVARPLMAMHWPELGGVVQPLAGEWAIRREHLASLPVPIGYGVEFATVVDTFERHGLDAIAQVDLGVRAHGHQSLTGLGAMAAELMTIADHRSGRLVDLPASVPLRQFTHAGPAEGGVVRVPVEERPPAAHVEEAAP